MTKFAAIGLFAAFANGFAAIISSRVCVAWSVRTCNETYYAVFRSEVNRERADRSDAIAEGHLHWIRPLAFLSANVLVIVFAVMLLTSE